MADHSRVIVDLTVNGSESLQHIESKMYKMYNGTNNIQLNDLRVLENSLIIEDYGSKNNFSTIYRAG